MNSRQRIKTSLIHKQPDKLPVDIGGTAGTGIHVKNVYAIRQRLGLDEPGIPVKVIEPYQMLGEIADDLKKIIGVDVAMLDGKYNMFGFANEDFKEWVMPDGTPVLVPKLFNTKINEDGSIFQYPKGNRSLNPSAKMPNKGFFFDAIERKKEIDEENLDPSDNLEEYKVTSDKNITFLKNRAEELYHHTDYAILGMIGWGSSFGDVAFIPGVSLTQPKGIRSIEEWYISTCTRKDYVRKIFEGQLEIALENFKRIFDAVGNKVEGVWVTGTDFGSQNGLFISRDSYRELYMPFHIKINEWFHKNTEWKSLIHSCGSNYEIIPDFIDAGFDILNPVQISARGMEPERLKKEFGKELTFWGGGVDTQKTLMFESPSSVKEQVKRMVDIFYKEGGFVFAAVHNVQANVPVDNIMAMIEALQEIKN